MSWKEKHDGVEMNPIFLSSKVIREKRYILIKFAIFFTFTRPGGVKI